MDAIPDGGYEIFTSEDKNNAIEFTYKNAERALGKLWKNGINYTIEPKHEQDETQTIPAK